MKTLDIKLNIHSNFNWKTIHEDILVLYNIHDTKVFIPLAEILLQGINTIDIEDIAVGPGPDVHYGYIYLADIGNNDENRDTFQIYRFPEQDFM